MLQKSKSEQHCYLPVPPQLLRDLPALVGTRQRKRGFRRNRMIEVGFILIDQRLTIPKIEAFHQWTARVEQIPHLVRQPFPSVFNARVVHPDRGYPGDVY